MDFPPVPLWRVKSPPWSMTVEMERRGSALGAEGSWAIEASTYSWG